MKIIEKNTAIIEKIFKDKKSPASALALIESYWNQHRLTEETVLLHKAYHVSTAVLNLNFADMKLYLINIYLNLEMGNSDKADEMMETIKPFKNHFKANDNLSYGFYTFLLALGYLKRNKQKAALKQLNVLTEYNNDVNDAQLDLLSAVLCAELERYPQAIEFLSYSYKNGCRSQMLYVCTLGCLNHASGSSFEIGRGLLYAVFRWGLNKQYDLNLLIKKYKDMIVQNFDESLILFEDIYRKYPFEELLQKIVIKLMEKFDYSAKAFYFYKEAEIKQLELPRLYYCLVKSAYLNKIENISAYSLKKFLASGSGEKELLPFVYHLIISQDKNTSLLEKYSKPIIEFGLECIRNGESGRYYNSIYQYAVRLEKTEKIPKETLDKLDKALFEDLFKSRIYVDNPDVGYIWVFEKEIKEIRKYQLTGNTRVIQCLGEKPECKFFDESQRLVLESDCNIHKLVENADIELYERLFKKSMASTELVVALAKHYMAQDKLPDESIDVLKQAAANSDVTNIFKMVVNATIGNYYAAKSDYRTAVYYYRGVDQNVLDDKYIEQMLLAYINAKEYDQVLSLLVKKAECISDRSLFFALKQLAGQKDYNRYIADMAYELILKSWYDKVLLNIVFEHYSGSLTEWQELSRALLSMSVHDVGLDEIILKNSIWMHMFDKGSQSVFCRMYGKTPGNILVGQFTEYCIYEIIINSVKPEYETINALEKIYADGEGKNRFLAYALCHVYLNYSIATQASEQILLDGIRMSEEDGFLFPAFKLIKDKKYISSYIEKNQPFIYRGFPDKKINLYYRFDDTQDFNKKEMKYVKYGMYFAHIPHFYGEKVTYYFSEEMKSGSIVTKEESLENNNMRLAEDKAGLYYVINNALIYERLFKYEMVEEIITEYLKERPRIKSWIM